jgi:hypothetical protein
MKRYHAWFERMSDRGTVKGGRQLAPEGKILSGRKGVTDGPFAESKEGIAGYWFIQAASLEEAVEIIGRVVRTDEQNSRRIVREFSGAAGKANQVGFQKRRLGRN